MKLRSRLNGRGRPPLVLVVVLCLTFVRGIGFPSKMACFVNFAHILVPIGREFFRNGFFCAVEVQPPSLLLGECLFFLHTYIEVFLFRGSTPLLPRLFHVFAHEVPCRSCNFGFTWSPVLFVPSDSCSL